jgi:RNAse (barnase) inhibitor barstar
MAKTKTKYIDMGQIESVNQLHQLFYKELKFSEFYGENWDAFRDAITCLIIMPKKLILCNWATFEKTLPADAKIPRSIIMEFNKQKNGSEIEVIADNND